MQVTDKAVSTDDDLKQGLADGAQGTESAPRFDVTKLEAVLATLLENKVEAIKQERKQSSVASSPKSIVHRLRITSTSTTSSGKDVDSGGEKRKGKQQMKPTTATIGTDIRRWQRMQATNSCETHSSSCGPQSQELSISSPDSQRLIRPQKSNLKSPIVSRQSSRETDDRSLPSFSRQESQETYPSFSRQDSRDSYRYGFGRQDSKDSRDSTSRILVKQDSRDSRDLSRFIRQDSRGSRELYKCCDLEVCKCKICLLQQRQHLGKHCYCEKSEIRLQRSFDEDYISLKIDEECCSDEEEAERRARRKRRRKRRRRLRRQLALEAMRGATSLPPRSAAEDKMKVLDNDDLPPKARWTIVATACVLLFLCLLLVGVTLRMAPLIDDMGESVSERRGSFCKPKHYAKTCYVKSTQKNNQKLHGNYCNEVIGQSSVLTSNETKLISNFNK
ncbi:hypothetical protein WA026_004157 [Henosepilachna vigintioctopunctata]|uniref:Uncharacterized protein n=1 Tax=Henosepilachna vigintioctopunctata TaxID=420089 RepID=A0AAW1U8P8_9CUCU